LRCPGCYIYEEGHVGGLNLRQLQDKRGDDHGQSALVRVNDRPLLRRVIAGGTAKECTFAQTATAVSVDLRSKIAPRDLYRASNVYWQSNAKEARSVRTNFWKVQS
jgi:hypothetical protein